MIRQAILSVFAATCIFSTAAQASDETFEKDLAAATAVIQAAPNDPNSYTRRLNLLSKAGRYSEAAADLEKQCKLTLDPDVRELCEMELKDYKAQHGL